MVRPRGSVVSGNNIDGLGDEPMGKASPATFANAKRRALRVLGQQAPDSFVPDCVMFFNDDLGFIIRLSNLSDDHHIQRMVSWVDVELARSQVVEIAVNNAVRKLAEAQTAD